MKWWLYLTAVLLGLVMLAYLIVGLNSPIHFAAIWSRDNQAKNTQSDVGTMPRVQAVRQDVVELRQKHHLRPLTNLEDGKPIQELPRGIFGFSMCSVHSIRAKRGNTFSLEIHKHDDGIVYYVGYASDEDIGKYLARQKNFHLLTFPYARKRASSLFEIPIEFITKCEERSYKDSYLYDLFVIAIPELHS